jgi:hypothetical protein
MPGFNLPWYSAGYVPPQRANLKIWIPCDGGSVDLVSSQAITITGSPSTTTGVIGAATVFDANTKYLNLGDKSSVRSTGTGDFTWAAWFKRLDTSVAHAGAVICSADSVGTRDFSFYTDVYEDGSNNCGIIWYSGATGIYALETTSSTNDTGWHQLVVVKSGSTAAIYTDGTSRAVTYLGGAWASSMSASTNSTLIGVKSYDSTTANQHQQHVMFWNVALSAGEVSTMYSTMLAG